MKKILSFILIMISLVMMTSCKSNYVSNIDLMGTKTGVYYELFVRSFADSDGDKIGDFNGVISKLDYLKELGIEGIWLMPIFESDSYHGYDVKNYLKINEDYGTLQEFLNLLDEAKKRDMKIILDIPFNHTSKDHEWFQKSIDVESKYHNYYNWIDENDERFGKLGSWNQNIWHVNLSNNLYYAGYFSNEMPDLNMENPKVREEIKSIANYWLSVGVDGFRLDAVLHQYGVNEYPSNIKPLAKNMMWWKEFKDSLVQNYPDAYLVGEAWTDSVLVSPFYYGLDSNFNFDISDLIINSLYSYNANYAKTIIRQHESFREYNKEFIDAPFLSNHDGNNKETKARIASILNGNESRMRLAAEMLLTLPGNPFIYYGEEIGMKGIRYGAPDYDKTLRTPMLWSKDEGSLEATWYTNSNFNQTVKPVDEQLQDPDSLLNHYKTLINLRKSSLALHDGDMHFYSVGERNFQSFVRLFDYSKRKDAVLVVHNVSNEESDLTFKDSGKLDILYQSISNDYKKTGKIGPRSTIIFQIPKNLINNYVKE